MNVVVVATLRSAITPAVIGTAPNVRESIKIFGLINENKIY